MVNIEKKYKDAADYYQLVSDDEVKSLQAGIYAENMVQVAQLVKSHDFEGLQRMRKRVWKCVLKGKLNPSMILQTMQWCEKYGIDFQRWLQIRAFNHDTNVKTLKMIDQALLHSSQPREQLSSAEGCEELYQQGLVSSK